MSITKKILNRKTNCSANDSLKRKHARTKMQDYTKILSPQRDFAITPACAKKVQFGKPVVIFSVLIICVMIAVFITLGASTTAHAFTNSTDLQNKANELNAKAAEIDSQIAQKDQVILAATNKKSASQEAKDAAKVKFDEAQQNIDNARPELEQKSKESYSTFLATELLSQMVGNEDVADTLFRWEPMKTKADTQDEEVQTAMNAYYDEKKAYEDVLNQDQIAAAELQTAQKEKADLEKQKTDNANELKTVQTDLDAMLEIEKHYGKCYDPRIVGNGYFCHPCPDYYCISSYFGESRGAGDSGGPVHKGVDFAAAMGKPIYAVADGKVVQATYTDDYNYGNGMWVVVEHADGLVTKYKHCCHVYVPIGTEVHKGDNIALVGSTGDSTGPHLHFQVEKDGAAVDPMPYLEDKNKK